MSGKGSLAKFILGMFRNDVLRHYRAVEEIDTSRDAIECVQQSNLGNLVEHCFQNVPYYRKRLVESGVVVPDRLGGDPEVHLEHFARLPVLTKQDVRDHFNELQSRDSSRRNTYHNSTGGSTGEPVVFIQDRHYQNWNWANKLYYAAVAGKKLGDPEIKLWGSEEDIFQGSLSLKERILNFVINRTLQNSFRMSRVDMREYLEAWNQVKPVLVWAYVDSIYELARMVKKEEINVFSPQVIITTAGTLDDDMRRFIEDVFNCDVLNQYGSREMGAIACECRRKDGLHIFEHSHLVEVVGDHGQPVVGEHGRIVVTNLKNYSMPLLRYSLNDTGVMGEVGCGCGREFRKLSRVTGRTTDHFVNRNGEIIHGLYFLHMFYYKTWVKKFRIIQEDYEHVRIMIETDEKPHEEDLNEFTVKVKKVMGEKCRIEFDFQEELKPSKSGKFMFTESRVR